ncbi:MAG: hypothetical protein Kow0031_22900 [Anaerolineae bacterium]
MSDYQAALERLHQNLATLREREAKYAGSAPVELLNQIKDHQQAIGLTERAIAGDLSEAAWRAKMGPLLVDINRRSGEAAAAVSIGDVSGGIHGSIIAGGDVKDVQLFQTGDVSGSYNVIGHGASLVIQQIEALSPAAEAAQADDAFNRRLARAIRGKVESYRRLVQKSDTERRNPYKSLNLEPESGSLVTGFGQAYTLSGDRFETITPRGRG